MQKEATVNSIVRAIAQNKEKGREQEEKETVS